MSKIGRMNIRASRAREWKKFRKENFFTQARLAEVLGISKGTVHNVELNRVQPRANTLYKFEILKEKYGRESSGKPVVG